MHIYEVIDTAQASDLKILQVDLKRLMEKFEAEKPRPKFKI